MLKRAVVRPCVGYRASVDMLAYGLDVERGDTDCLVSSVRYRLSLCSHYHLPLLNLYWKNDHECLCPDPCT